MRSLFLIAVILLSGIPTIKGDEKPEGISTAAGFLTICQSVDKSYSELDEGSRYQNISCLAWIEGFFRGISVSEELHNIPRGGRITCMATGVTNYQLVHIIRKYITDHPELEHNPTEGLAALALQSAFPCR
jgi:Ssp1 endopeptidase immunity protein Rap1a